MRDFAEYVAGVQVPGVADDLQAGCGGSVYLAHTQVGGGLDGVALGSCTAMLGQAQADGLLGILLSLAELAEVAVCTGGVSSVAAFVEFEPVRFLLAAGG